MPQTRLLDLSPEDSQLGKYRLIATLGQGGMGTVHLALASGLGTFRKLLVVKELRRDVPWKDSALAMFLDEAHLAARLSHPNVLQTFEAGEDRGRHFLAMEYLDGQPLSVLLDRTQLSLALKIHVLCEVLEGLSYAHELRDYDGTPLQVVHRDISPQNVFVTYHGQIKVVDFGVAKASYARSNLTSPGVFKGKFAYAAPEQLLGRPVDGRCDVFSVGVLLWEAISGRRFSDLPPTPESFRTRTTQEATPLAQLVPDVDPRLAAICARALTIAPEQRTASAAELRGELQEYLTSLGERVESAQLAHVMREAFVEERRQRQQLIERLLMRSGPAGARLEQQGTGAFQILPPVEPGLRTERSLSQARRIPEQQTGRSRLQTPDAASSLGSDLPARVRRLNPWRWSSTTSLAGLAAVVFGLTFALSRSCSESSLSAARDRVQVVPLTSPQPAAAALPVAIAPAAPEETLEPLPEAPAEPAPKPVRTVRLRPVSIGREHSGTAHSADAVQPVPAKPFVAKGARARAAVNSSEARAIDDELMGSNLQELRRRPVKPIDTDDPYR